MNEQSMTQLGSYRIVGRIGSGGMATVYKAYHPATKRHVAIKVLPEQMSTEPEFRRRFEQEAQVIAGLEHSHILPVHDYGQAGNLLYLVMRYIQAGTLKDRITAGPLSLAETDRILQQVGSALDYAHRLGVIHRDVKPGNVLLDNEGNCYLTDFGLAKILESSTQLTGSGVGVGTPAYMSPEQGQGENADARSDIYSLGVMVYEMLAGRVPYQAETPLAVVLMHISAPLPPLRALCPQVPAAVEQVIFKAIAKNPADRFQTVPEMMEAFSAAVATSAQTLPDRTEAAPRATPTPRLGSRPPNNVPFPSASRRKMGWIWAAGAGVLAILCIAALVLALVLSPIRVRLQDGQVQLVRVPRGTPAIMATTPSSSVPTAAATTDTQATPAVAAATTTAAIPTSTAASLAAATATLKPAPTATPSPSPVPWSSAFVPLTELDQGGAVAFSPDGQILAVAGDGVTLYDTTSWQPARTWPGAERASGLAFSPDGKTLAVLTRQLTLFDAASGAERYTVPDLEFSTSAASSYFISFSPDGEKFAVIVDDVIKLYATADGRESGLILAQGTYAIAFSPNGRTLATAGWSDGVRLWDVTTGQAVRTLGEEQRYSADRIAFTPDGSKLVAAGSERDPIMIWDADTGRSLGSWSGHTGKVNAMAFSADGRLLVTASEDVTVRIWDVTTGRELQTLIGHTKAVIGAALSPDGTKLATCSYEMTRLWSFSAEGATPTPAPTPAAAGPQQTRVPLSLNAISSENASLVVQIALLEKEGAQAAWSPDGKLLAIAQREVSLYDTTTWQMVRTIPLNNWVYGIAFSPDGASLAVLDGEYRVFEVATGAEVTVLPNVHIATSAAAGSFFSFSPDGSLFAAVVDEVVKLYETRTWREVGILLTGGVDVIIFTPDGRFVATGDWSGGVRLWDITTGQQVRAFGEEQMRGVHRIAFSPDGTRVAASPTGSDPIMIWDASTGRSLGTLSGHNGVNTIAFSPGGRLLVTASPDVTAHIWDVTTNRELKALIGHTSAVTSAAFSPDGAVLVTTSQDGTTRLWAVDTTGAAPAPGLAQVTPGPTMTPVPLSASAISPQNASQVGLQMTMEREGKVAFYSPDGKLLAVARDEVVLYDTTTWQVVRTIPLDNWAYGIGFSPDGASLAVLDGACRVFDMATGAEVTTLPGVQVSTSAASSSFFSYSPDGSLFAVIVDEVVKFYETQTWREVDILLAGGPHALAFAPDGRMLVTAGWSNGVKLWDIQTGQQVRTFGEGQMHGAERAILSPDGTKLATSSVVDNAIAIWDVDTGRSRGSLSGHTGRVSALVFSPDGRLLATASEDVTARIWDVAAGRELKSLVGHTASITSVAFSPDGAVLVTTSQDGTTRLWSVQ